MVGKSEPIYVTSLPRRDGHKVGKIRNVRFQNILCKSENGIVIHSDETAPIEDLVLDNVRRFGYQSKDLVNGQVEVEMDFRPNEGNAP